mmetsp:Transcript_29966/g.34341  ORF Transcript_29966/g.34341 Transcript_29966/m.34341 type:complete len:88 (-) Transcript_29966:20-283(-)
MGWMKNYPDLKLVLIMIVVPIILNSIQFWLQDNILKGKKENMLKFVNSPYNDRSYTPKIPAKLTIPNKEGRRISDKEIDKSISEYWA